MVLLIGLVLFVTVIIFLSRHLRQRRDARSLWRSVVLIGVSVGGVRAVLASAGWYTVEHTGGPLQIPGFAFAMMAWPEAAVFTGRRGQVAPLEFYLYLTALLMVSTTVWVALVALITRTASR
jgi:hypothetical protein